MNKKLLSITLQTSIVFLMTLCFTSRTQALPVNLIPDLTSITFWERTGGLSPNAYTFGVSSSELTTLLSNPLSSINRDIAGASTEYYDVYYSNSNGDFNLNGEYLTISGTFLQSLPAGGGLNLAEIGLNFNSSPVEYGNYVASYFAAGDNAIPSSVGNSIDGDLLTHTTMGNTIGQNERLRVTLGFLSSSGEPPSGEPPPNGVVPEPTTMFLFGAGLVGAVLRRKIA